MPTLVLVVSETEPEERFQFNNLHWLEMGKIQEGLMVIR